MSRLTKISGAPFRFFGDKMRDKRRWSRAAWFYHAYVAMNPRDAALLVQLGNCSKEAGDFTNAARAYERALALNPDDSETRAALQFVGGVPSIPASQNAAALAVFFAPIDPAKVSWEARQTLHWLTQVLRD